MDEPQSGADPTPGGRPGRVLSRPAVPLAPVVAAGAAFAGLGAAVAALNRVTLPRLTAGEPVGEPVTVVVPARDEADRIAGLVGDLRSQRGTPRFAVCIVDDFSTDGTAEVAIRAAAGDPRFTVCRPASAPPPGWTGKAAACTAAFARLGAVPDGIVVFVDADVRLGADAIAAAASLLRRRDAALVSPWPRQLAVTPLERLVQPLLFWSWFSILPVVVAHRTVRPSMAVACGQFLVFDSRAYAELGGHAAVAASATEDLALARLLRRRGRRTVVAAAGRHASCRMYPDARSVAAGYTRWLWSAFGSPAGAAAAVTGYTAGFVLPPLAAVAGRGAVRRWGLAGTAAGFVSRMLAASSEHASRPTVGDAASAVAHPAAVAVFGVFTAASLRLRRAGRTRWKQRPLP